MRSPLLSILIPTVPERALSLARLVGELSRQSESLGDRGRQLVEVLYLGDTKRMTVGDKRNRLLDAAAGQYVAFCDDDDFVAPGYLASILCALADEPDVVCFRQRVELSDGFVGEVHFGLEHPVRAGFGPDNVSRRFPWHVCAWRADLARLARFAPVNYGEDAAWVLQMVPLARRAAVIPAVLHYYKRNETPSLTGS